MVGKIKPEFGSEEQRDDGGSVPGRSRQRLKAVELLRLKAGKYCDGDGLYLNVETSGSRSWILRTIVNGKRREIGLGSLATTQLLQAREKAAALRAKARRGEDILEQKRIEQQANSIPTFQNAATTVHKNLAETLDSEAHAYNWLQSLKKYVFPVFGKKTVDKMDSSDVLAAISPMWNEVPDTASRTLRRIKAVFDWCQVSGFRTVNVNGVPVTMPHPCEAIRAALPKQNKKENHHEALPYSQLPDFIQKLRMSPFALAVKLGFEFLILTCSRTSEVLAAKWDEINMESRLWTVPGERMKMDREHKVPLSPRCIEILQLAKQFNDGAIVFPGRYPGQPLSSMALLMPLRRMGYDLTVHGFRATFKTWAEETTKFDHLVIEASMAHAVKGIERHYLRTTFFDQRRKLMDAWARFATKAPAEKAVKISR